MKEKLGFAHTLPKNDKRLEKYKKQRKDRGWDDTELWSLDTTIAKFIVPRLKRFKETVNGHPNEFTFEEWKVELQKMIDAFEYVANDDEYYSYDKKKIKMCDVGMKSFHKYFSHLWN